MRELVCEQHQTPDSSSICFGVCVNLCFQNCLTFFTFFFSSCYIKGNDEYQALVNEWS
jgi:hypothetical protein